ncbi:MAG: tRNA (adenine(22)-N(1))-methyltransferase TrmK, partial [Lachnospiraceae bacterium]|nr:tRNA (adenine(22)-N(1))-methyltransferase TrmK [Lachnospiraceae bacterium]
MVLQPQSEIEQFRRFLTEDGWCILEEDMVLEDGKYYPMMSVTKKETAMPLDNPYRNAKDIDFLYGAYL